MVYVCGVNRKEYNELNSINFSLLKHYLKSPKHFYHAWKNPSEDEELTKAMMLGRAIHGYVLEPDKFKDQFAFLDFEQRPVKENKNGGVADYRTKANAEWKASQIEHYKSMNVTLLPSKDDYDTIVGMGASVSHNKPSATLLRGCENEKVIQWTDAETGVKCKGIIDFLNPSKRMNGDLKSMEDASPSAFSMYMKKWMTYMQLAFYSDGCEAVYGEPFNTSFVIAVEKSAPYVVQAYYIDEADIELGRKMYRSLLNIHKRCVESKEWGSYDTQYENINGVIVAKLPQIVHTMAEADEKLQNN